MVSKRKTPEFFLEETPSPFTSRLNEKWDEFGAQSLAIKQRFAKLTRELLVNAVHCWKTAYLQRGEEFDIGKEDFYPLIANTNEPELETVILLVIHAEINDRELYTCIGYIPMLANPIMTNDLITSSKRWLDVSQYKDLQKESGSAPLIPELDREFLANIPNIFDL